MRITDSAHGLLPRGSRVLCAVSGGSDSICLLHLLWERREDWGLTVFAAHFEHGLRGEESLADARFVVAFCRERGIPCTVGHGDVPACAAEKRLGVEAAARELRYAFLERTADVLGCDRIATAHNADDNAETVLMNLTRGSGLRGLGGIPPERGRIVRPLLGIPRREIEEYLAENGLPHREDLSNADERYRRNRIRHAVLPVLREMNPAFSQAVSDTAALCRQDEELLQSLAADFIRTQYRDGSLPVGELIALHPSVSSRVVRTLCECSLSREHVEDVLRFCAGGGLGFIDLPGQRLRRERGRLYFEAEPGAALPERRIRPGESLELPEAGLRVRADLVEYNQKINSLFKTYCFKYEKLCGTEILITGRRPGDRMHPANRGCGKSLKALFGEAGMTRAERDRTPVFRDAEGILAVYGLAVDERALPAPGDRVLRLTIEKREDVR